MKRTERSIPLSRAAGWLSASVVALAITACGADAEDSRTSSDAAANNVENDAGTESDTGSETDANTSACAPGQPVEECTRGGLNILLNGGSTIDSASGFVNWYADDGQLFQESQLTDTCWYSVPVEDGNVTGPDCLDAGTLTIRHDSGDITIEPGENCYSSQFDAADIRGQTVTFSFSGGADYSALDLEVDILETIDVTADRVDGGVEIVRTDGQDSQWGIVIYSPDGTSIFCGETSPGEIVLTAEDIAAIRGAEGDHSDAQLFHSGGNRVVQGDLSVWGGSQHGGMLLGLIPNE